ncbi:MAG: type II 3-dehydroquinate dehydratase [Chitinophagales bacterium]|nr:type II 3-dehydroquinate dehydratase [Bacteroidota bacterium]MCB9044104.1 type II 3-dehydroquinate dehydratase [Chitinophagales bacterium]
MHIHIINGPNLNLLGKRQVQIYGNQSFEDYYAKLQKQYPLVQFSCFQDNSEGKLIDNVQEMGYQAQGIILNAAAYSHTSVALADAVAAVPAPVIEVHISNVFARETHRHHSFLSPLAKGIIAGFGLDSYRLAVEAIMLLHND